MRGLCVLFVLCSVAVASAQPTGIRVVDLTQSHELSELFSASVQVRGLVFEDPACAKFSISRAVTGADLPKLAGCLFQPNVGFETWPTAHEGHAVIAIADRTLYDQKLLLELEYVDDHLTRITGFDADLEDLDLPTIFHGKTYTAFKPSKKLRAAIERDLEVFAKVCEDENGKVTSTRIVDESDSKAFNAEVEKHLAAIKQRAPIVIAGTALPACDMIDIASPQRDWTISKFRRVHQEVKHPTDPIELSPEALSKLRIAGTSKITPDAATAKAIIASAAHFATAWVSFCISTTGEVTSLRFIEHSTVPDYDTAVAAAIQAWKFKPYIEDGSPREVCGGGAFSYSASTAASGT